MSIILWHSVCRKTKYRLHLCGNKEFIFQDDTISFRSCLFCSAQYLLKPSRLQLFCLRSKSAAEITAAAVIRAENWSWISKPCPGTRHCCKHQRIHLQNSRQRMFGGLVTSYSSSSLLKESTKYQFILKANDFLSKRDEIQIPCLQLHPIRCWPSTIEAWKK